ncbi:DUF1266 domain-containing protein [Allokutzneria albata]|uniref:DUF1266 domain-containing protein n=1 Tax=Allokutzneria albata TaxID=211114 RepID=A0A1G9RUF9_ALLAB|nr:DUF1266 domain-containing protein [Allokutzneria albata]SDM26813.1 Protein of unknown function [Allokutzneria albata]
MTPEETDDHDEVLPAIEPPSDVSPWTAPTDVEQFLYEHRDDEDPTEALRLLARTGLYHPIAITATSPDIRERRPLTQALATGQTVAIVYTEGVLPRPHPHVVYEFATLGALSVICPPEVDVLAINPRTPCELYVSAADVERDTWWEMSEELFDPEGSHNRVVTRRSNAAEPGPLLHGLACGAHLCFGNGDPWNTLDWHGAGYSSEVERLAEWWGVHDRADWLDVQQRLVEREVSPWYWDFVLGTRNHVDAEAWRQRVATENPVLTELVGKVLRYEARFRADGLLPADGYVRSVAAWDFGRASQMARWGYGARYASRAEMEQALLRTAEASRAVYRSWAEFSAAYILGRCLHFDEEEFGTWYTDVLEAHHALMAAPNSPWRTVPFR